MALFPVSSTSSTGGSRFTDGYQARQKGVSTGPRPIPWLSMLAVALLPRAGSAGDGDVEVKVTATLDLRALAEEGLAIEDVVQLTGEARGRCALALAVYHVTSGEGPVAIDGTIADGIPVYLAWSLPDLDPEDPSLESVRALATAAPVVSARHMIEGAIADPEQVGVAGVTYLVVARVAAEMLRAKSTEGWDNAQVARRWSAVGVLGTLPFVPPPPGAE